MERCVYCGTAVPEEKPLLAKAHTRSFPVCSTECKQNTEDYVAKDKKRKLILYMVILCMALVVIYTAVTERGMNIAYWGQIAVGVAFFLLPYPISSFETFQNFSIRAVIRLCKIVGTVLAGAGVLFLLLL